MCDNLLCQFCPNKFCGLAEWKIRGRQIGDKQAREVGGKRETSREKGREAEDKRQTSGRRQAGNKWGNQQRTRGDEWEVSGRQAADKRETLGKGLGSK